MGWVLSARRGTASSTTGRAGPAAASAITTRSPTAILTVPKMGLRAPVGVIWACRPALTFARSALVAPVLTIHELVEMTVTAALDAPEPLLLDEPVVPRAPPEPPAPAELPDRHWWLRSPGPGLAPLRGGDVEGAFQGGVVDRGQGLTLRDLLFHGHVEFRDCSRRREQHDQPPSRPSAMCPNSGRRTVPKHSFIAVDANV